MKTNEISEKTLATGYTNKGEELKVIARYDKMAICQGVFVVREGEEFERADEESAMALFNEWKGTPYWKTPLYAKEVATVALQQIKGLAGMNYYTWGVDKLMYLFYEEMPTLALRVHGFVHDGWVLVSLNEGADLYEIRLKGKDIKTETTRKIKDVYFDQLAEIIDEWVEKPADQTEEDYHKKALEWIVTSA